jgi:hypothetical protein
MFQETINYILGSKEIVAVLITAALSVIGYIVLLLIAAKPKIKYGIFSNDHLIPRDNEGKMFSVFTQNIFFTNTGRATADELEVIFNFRPFHLEIYPTIPYELKDNPDGRLVFSVSKLNPKERLNIRLLNSHNPLPEVINVRWRGGQGKLINIGPQQLFPKWFNLTIFGLLVLGVITAIYIPIRFLIGW